MQSDKVLKLNKTLYDLCWLSLLYQQKIKKMKKPSFKKISQKLCIV